MKRKTNISVQDNRGIRVTPSIILGDKFEGYASGDLLDANAVKSLVYDDPSIGDKYYEKQKDILIEEDGVYQIKDNAVYPVAHPDLSTQPSVLPQRFGNLEVKEVLIAKGREYEIPENATVINAWSFNDHECCAAVVKKETVFAEGYVDLGLPSGTLWASCNLGANNPEDIGLYVSWGETEGWNNAEFHDFNIGSNKFVSSSGRSYYKYTLLDNKHTLDLEDDIIYVATNGKAKIPTDEHIRELFLYCLPSLCTINNKEVVKLLSNENGNCIYIPFSGYISGNTAYATTTLANIWTSSLSPAYGDYREAYYGQYDKNEEVNPLNIMSITREKGMPVRGIAIPEEKWFITNDHDINPDFTLVQYVEGDNKYYTENEKLTTKSSMLENNSIITYYAYQKISDPDGHFDKPILSHTFVSNLANPNFGYGRIIFDGQVTKMRRSPFIYSQGLCNVTLPDSIDTICEEAFMGCHGLRSIYISKNLKLIPAGAFNSCTALNNITIPNKVNSIEKEAFLECNSVQNVIIGSNVSYIGPAAFKNSRVSLIKSTAKAAPQLGYWDVFSGVPTVGTLLVPLDGNYETWLNYDLRDWEILYFEQS